MRNLTKTIVKRLENYCETIWKLLLDYVKVMENYWETLYRSQVQSQTGRKSDEPESTKVH